VAQVVKNLPAIQETQGPESACNMGDPGFSPGLGRSPGEGNGNPLHYSCLENSMDRGTWWAFLSFFFWTLMWEVGHLFIFSYLICKHIREVMFSWPCPFRPGIQCVG